MRVSKAFTSRCVTNVTLLVMGGMLFVTNVRRATAFSIRSGYTTNARQRRSVKTTTSTFAILGDNLSHIAGESTDSKRAATTGRKTRSFSPKQPKPSDTNERLSEKENSKSNAFIDHYNSYHSGDWAGQSATFHAQTSELVPVPEYYVPESLLEWGQAPSCLEVLTSESKIEETKLTGFIPASQLTWAESMETMILERTEVRVLPEVGCGLDNLETLKTTEKLNLRWQNAGQDTINKPTRGAFMRNDTFAFITEPLDQANKPLDGDRKLYTTFFPSPDQRIRITCTMGKRVAKSDDASLSSPTLEIRTPVTMVVERKTSDVSSGGTIADGGGLYASRVCELVGMDRINKPFSDKWGGITGDAAIANDLWECETRSSTTIDSNTRDHFSCVNLDCVQTIHLPLGVTLRVFASDSTPVSTVTKTKTTIVQTSWVSSDGDQRTVLETFVHPHGTPGWNYSTQTK